MWHSHTLRSELDQHFRDMQKTGAHVCGKGHQFSLSPRQQINTPWHQYISFLL